uniref:Reverse transcriptase domain-containing protein n=1 Tax=Salarias fasciatus TaxID=181472 RepID=A0A672FAG9_SALFA
MREDRRLLKHYGRPCREKSNITTEEFEGLINLIKNSEIIIIKPADKGNTPFIWSNTYLKNWDTIPMVGRILNTLQTKGFSNQKQKTYLMGEPEPRTRRFYTLPKIHKEPEKWTVPFQVPPGRPIVSHCGSETYRTAEYIDSFLTPLSIRHPSYIKDTYNFLVQSHAPSV